jgi:hypothetical protein
MMRVMHAQSQISAWAGGVSENSSRRGERVTQLKDRLGSVKWDRCFRIEFSGCGKADLQSVGHVFEQVSAMSPGWTLDPAIILLTKKILARKMDPRVKPAGEDQTTLGAR